MKTDTQARTFSLARLFAQPALSFRAKGFSREFWIFFTAAFFFDFGFAVYFFLFNLFLVDLHFNERAIGLIGGALTVGSLIGTLPAGFLVRRFGLRPVLMTCFTAAPVVGMLRTSVSGEHAQIGLAFCAGLAMCLWGVCFLAAITGLTTPANRASAFGLIFSTSIGTSTLGGLVCGYLPHWLRSLGLNLEPVQVKRAILLTSCAIAAIGLLAVVRLKPGPSTSEDPYAVSTDTGLTARPWWKPDGFTARLVFSMALWSAVIAAFTPFANVYLERGLHVPLQNIGLIFSASQLIQFCAGLLTPVLFRRLGLINGIFATQLMTGLALISLSHAGNGMQAASLYLVFSAMQWMSSPGLYNLLMSHVDEKDRSTTAAMTMFCNAAFSSVSTSGAGELFTLYGYPHVLGGVAAFALLSALIFRFFVGSPRRTSSSPLTL